MRERFGSDVRFEVGWASPIGHGLYRTIYSAVITPDSEERAAELEAVAAIPRSDAPPTTFDAVAREVELLTLIAAQATSFRTPGWTHAAEIDNEPAAADAAAWIRDHLPPDDPTVLLHGDLLGQNILFDPDRPPARHSCDTPQQSS